MSDGALQVELVAADRTVWSGEATMVIARTVDGDVGVLKGHAPLLSLLTDAVIEISEGNGQLVFATVEGGFLSVANDRVSILSERSILAEEIDVNQAQTDLESARHLSDDEAGAAIRRAETRIRAAEKLRAS
ncbi:F0F1 ATP synthase subunit epsilon [Nocardioides salsibiostraticola]